MILMHIHSQTYTLIQAPDINESCAFTGLPGCTWWLLEIAVFVIKPSRNGRESSCPFSEGHGFRELSIALGSALAKSGSEWDQRLCQDEDDTISLGWGFVAIHELARLDVLGQMSQDL